MNKWEELDNEFEDNEEEDVGFGTCEECGCTLYSMPSAGWGVGYVCSSCAYELKNEL